MMVKKPKVEVDEEAMRRMIAGLIPQTADITREVQASPEEQKNVEKDGDTKNPSSSVSTMSEPRRRRTMIIPDFEQTFMTLMNIRLRGALYVSIGTKRKILEVVKKIGGEHMTATSYVENILRQHLELYKDEINRIYKEQSIKNLI